ncbi:MAG: hypothetical protein HRF49_10205 [bacterium]|jgi:lipopolysaccharide biosynthesis regulator YciM
MPNRRITFAFAIWTIAAILLFFPRAAAAGEAVGSVRGRIVNEAGIGLTGVRISILIDGVLFSETVTDENGAYTLEAPLGRRSFQWLPGYSIFGGFKSKTQSKMDIRMTEADIVAGETAKPLFNGAVPVYFSDLNRYAVYLCEIVVPSEGSSYWRDPGYFSVGEVKASPSTAREGHEIVFEVPVMLPPHREMVESLRVVFSGGMFKEGRAKAFDDGKAPDRVRGDGIYTLVYKVPEKGPFGFFVVSASVLLPELSARFEPGAAWPLMFSETETSEAGGHYEKITQVYSLGGTETGLAAEWYYFLDPDDKLYWLEQSYKNAAKAYTKERWYEMFARGTLDRKSAGVFICRGMVEQGAATYLASLIRHYEAGEFELAEKKLEQAKSKAPDYESIPLWESKLCEAKGDLDGAIAALEDSKALKRDAYLGVVLAELYRKAGREREAVNAYAAAYNATNDPQVLRTLAHYLFEQGAYSSAQRAFDSLKYYAMALPYRYDFLMDGDYDFEARFRNAPSRGEKALFADFAPPGDAWQEDLFEEAFIFGSLAGWKAAEGRVREKDLKPGQLKKYSVMLRLSGDLDKAAEIAAMIPDAGGMFEQGLVALEQAMAEEDESAKAHLLARAQELLENAANDDLENADYSYALALARYLSGDRSRAKAEIAHTVELDPRHQEARFLAARIYEESGELEEALKHWQWFTDEEPEGVTKILAGEKVAELKALLHPDE